MTLPPVPDDVVRVVNIIDVDGSSFEFAWWWFVPGLAAGGYPWLAAAITDVEFYLLGPLTGAMHSGASWSTCRLESGGAMQLRVVGSVATNHGAYTGGQADAIASGFYVLSSSGGRGSGTRCRIPGCPDEFVANGRALSQVGVARLLSVCNAVIAVTNALVAPLGGNVVLGTLRRKTAAGPLAAAQFDPAAGVIPSYRIERLGRRLPARGQLSSP